VLGNWRKHREDVVEPMRSWPIDWFSTAWQFPGWAEYAAEPFLRPTPPTYEPMLVHLPRSWLLREGWRKAGPISCWAVPSSRP
jgi:hypothetical protein